VLVLVLVLLKGKVPAGTPSCFICANSSADVASADATGFAVLLPLLLLLLLLLVGGILLPLLAAAVVLLVSFTVATACTPAVTGAALC
jgi:hypothetical protein